MDLNCPNLREEKSSLFGITPFKTTLVCSSSPPVQTLDKEDKVPLPRSGHRMVCVDRRLFILGGYNPNLEDNCDPFWQLTKPLFAELWRFNTVTDTWTKMFQCHMEKSDGLVSFGCAVSGFSMFHLGGTGVPFGESSHNCLRVCDLQTGAWEKVETAGASPLSCYGQAVTLDDNELYVVGGTTGYEYNMDVHKINVVDRVWEQLYQTSADHHLPMTRYRHEIILHGENLLVFGGGQKEATAPLDRLPAFSLTALRWHQVVATEPDPATNTYPLPRKCHVTVQHENYVYIHGGCNEHISYGDMWRLDLRTLLWQELPHAATSPRHFHAASLTQEGCLYLHGGVLANTESSAERSGDLLKCWLTVPSLHRMSWDALRHYFPHIVRLTPLQLYHLGVPNIDIRDSDLETPQPEHPCSSLHQNVLEFMSNRELLVEGGRDVELRRRLVVMRIENVDLRDVGIQAEDEDDHLNWE
ncbi:kelch domain-containing protein 10 [Hyalella azteca]|uniref:Kelch domain-containing protein 10 n=1 Tax=Hyalella azteca TaxID=294128 RepID=A0A8B7NX87_HYAAZ|nr:kelch domain-containing protein 10 [Hyalella azteca]